MTTPPPILPKNDPNRTTGRFTGIYPNNTYPLVAGQIDLEQEKRKQARQESARTRRVVSATARAAHPPFVEKGPNAPWVLIDVNPVAPTYNSTTKVLTIPTKANISYFNITNRTITVNAFGKLGEQGVVLLSAGTRTLTASMVVEARPNTGYRIPQGAVTQYTFTYTA